jgi:hypothetical protein
MCDESTEAARIIIRAIAVPIAIMVMSTSIAVPSSLLRIYSNSSHKFNIIDMQLCKNICWEELSRMDPVIKINAASDLFAANQFEKGWILKRA